MEGAKICGSLAEYFLKIKDAKQQYLKLNPESNRIANYMIKASQLRSDVKCSSDNKCQWFDAKAEERSKSDLQTYILCVSCNRLFHVRCTGVDFSDITEEHLPWICHVCQSNPLNQAAKAVVFMDTHLMSFKNRILEFCQAKSTVTGTVPKKAPETKQIPKEIEIDQSIYEIADDSHVDSISHDELLRKFKQLHARYVAVSNQNDDLQRTMYENTQVPQPMFSSTGIAKNTAYNSPYSIPTSNPIVNPPTIHNPQISAPSYTSAILQANYAATRIDDELNRSKENGQAFFSSVGNNIRNDASQYNNARPEWSASNARSAANNASSINDCLAGISTQVTLLSLGEIRKSLPKIDSFDGRPEKWLAFQRAIERTWHEGQYDDPMMRRIIRKALTGQALERVDGILDLISPEQTMKYLKDSYGNANVVVEAAKLKLLNARLSKPLTHASCVEVTTYIASYMAACSYAGLVITDNALATKIHHQLESYHQEAYYKFYYDKYPNAVTRMERLDVQFDFLNYIAKTLPIGTFVKSENKNNKAKGFQVMSMSTGPSSHSSKSYSSSNFDGYKFEVRDQDTAKYLGYDMEKVSQLPKKCEICGARGHFSVECKQYRSMKMDEKFNIARMKNLCNNCMLTTTHIAKDCELKSGCGYKLDKNARCTGKHHVTLHRSNSYRVSSDRPYKKQQRRANTHNNAARANERMAQQTPPADNNHAAPLAAPVAVQVPVQAPIQAPVRIQQVQPQIVPGYHVASPIAFNVDHHNNQIHRPYIINTITAQTCAVSESSQRTVKLFRTIFYGKSNKASGFAIGDSAAEITLVKRELIDDLGIKGKDCIINLQWTDSIVKSTEALKVKLEISGILENSERLILDECYAIHNLELPPRTLNVEILKQNFPHLKKVPFISYKDAIPSMLIGSRHAHMIEAVEPVIQDGSNKPVAIRSKLGFTIYGGAPECFHKSYTVSNLQLQEQSNNDPHHVSNEMLEKIYTYSCSLDNLGIKPKDVHYTKKELEAIAYLDKNMKVLPNGFVEVPLIWNCINGEIPRLPDNFPMVYKRQIATENKLKKSPELLTAYNNNFIQLINENYVRPATERDIKSQWPNIHYLPMTLVVNHNKVPIKTRNVYDASAIYHGTSLNDNLLMGPNMLVDMLKPLMRMRMHIYAFTGDVKSMFHRVMINESDQQCQRILFRQNLNDPMQIYIMQVMLFGPKCSPFTSQMVKNRTAHKWLEQYPNAAEALEHYTYMDDILTSEPTAERAISTASQCIEILKSINWHLGSFQSNSLEVLQALNQDHVKTELIEIMSEEESSYTTKVLGVAWNPKLDAFVFNLNKNAFIKLAKDCGLKPTKRDQCSTIARIFDVMGLIAHCIIRGKMLLQNSWRKKLGWDDEISDEDHIKWLQWLKDLEKVSLLKIPRLRFPSRNMSEADSLELHCFCDAGKEAIAASTYMVATIKSYRYVSFVMAKAKVAPLKVKTKTEVSEMPRLELLSCLVGSRLTQTIVNLHIGYKLSVHMWSDSEIVLNWLKNENIKLPKFAISPVEEILELTTQDNWHYVESKNNVADLATKFQKFDFGDINSPWFQGPSFLKLPAKFWPKPKIKKVNPAETLVCNVNYESVLINTPIKLPPVNCPIATDYIIDLFSPSILGCWSKLKRATARALKFYYEALIPLARTENLELDEETRQQIKQSVNFETLNSAELERAELFLIRRMQREVYGDEYDRLSKGLRISNTELLQLNVFLDSNGVMRISSRVNEPINTYAQKFAPLAPRKSMLSIHLLLDYHYAHNHYGLEAQVADLRSRFWMPQARSALKRVQRLCNYCAYRRVNPTEYKMSPLPNVRTDSSLKPFEVTGLDCAGPFTIFANNGHAKKVWILIFTCTMSRFVHLQLLDNLTSLAVFEAIMTLWASHGPIRQFISDNGTNFVGAANIIHSDSRKIIQFLRETKKEIETELAEKTHASWAFIPVQSPWFGGFYERLIQSVKKSIAASIEDRKVTRIAFNIALQEAAHRINCRPLTHNPISSEDEEVLTPHHLAKFRSGWPLLQSIHGMKSIPDPLSDKNQYRRGRILAEEMSRKFVSQYLPVLTKRTKWFKDFTPLKAGDLVLLIDPNYTRKAWERARVKKVYYAKDGNGRVADILMPDGTEKKNRSVKRLAKLDIQTL